MPCWSAFGSEKRKGEKTTTDCDVLRRLLEETSGISDEEKSTWMADLERDLIDAWIALLLTRLKKLRKLRLVWSFESTYVLSVVERASRKETPGFLCLGEVHAGWFDDSQVERSDFMDPFFKFPSMRKLGGYSDYIDDYRDEKPDPDETTKFPKPKLKLPPPRSSNITDLDFHDVQMAVIK